MSKADLPRFGLDRAREALPDGYLDVSTQDGTGVERLKERCEKGRLRAACFIVLYVTCAVPPFAISSEGGFAV